MQRTTETTDRVLHRSALLGALTGLAVAALVAIPLSLFSAPPVGIEADAFAAYVDGAFAPESGASTVDRAYALNR